MPPKEEIIDSTVLQDRESRVIRPVAPQDTPIPDLASINTDVASLFPATPQEERQSLASRRAQELTGQTVGESEFRARAEKEADLAGKRTAVTDLASQLTQQQAESAALREQERIIPLQLQEQATGRGITAGGLAPLQTARLRQLSIRQGLVTSRGLQTAASLEAARGNVSAALDTVDRAVEAEFGPIREQLNAQLANIELIKNDPATTREELVRAEVAERRINAEKEQQSAIAEQRKEISKIVVDAASRGATSLQLRQLSEAQTTQEALETAADFGFLEEQVSELDQLKAEQIRAEIGTEKAKRLKTLSEIVPKGSDVGVTNLEFGTPEYAAAIIDNSARFGDSKLIGAQLEQVQQATSALASLESLNGLLSSGKDGVSLTGPLKGRVRTLATQLGGDATAAQINATIQGLIPTVARGIFGEVGVLTDTDIENYKKTLPNLKGTDEQNRLISIVMLDVLSNRFANVLLSNANNQVNVSNFAADYENIRNRVETEKLKLGVTPFSELDNDEFLDTAPTAGLQSFNVKDLQGRISNFMNLR